MKTTSIQKMLIIKHSTLWLLKRSSLIFFLFFSFALPANWDPKCLKKPLKILQEKQFVDLKKRIHIHLENTWCSEEKATMLMDLIALTRPKVCVEVGVFSGYSLLPIVATLRYLKHGYAYGIDAWSNAEAVRGMDPQNPNYKWWSEVKMTTIIKEYVERMSEWRVFPYLTTIALPSRDAIEQIDSIDFLNLDGNSSSEGSIEDVLLYLPKVKKGGYIILSNAFQTSTNNTLTKMDALSILVDHCEVIAEIDNSNTILLQKL